MSDTRTTLANPPSPHEVVEAIAQLSVNDFAVLVQRLHELVSRRV